MKLLIFEWAAGTYTYNDIAETLDVMGISHRTVSYQFEDKNEDEFFVYRFGQVLEDDSYDAVFSVNYFPLVAKCCNERSIKYISWSYDNPLDVPDIEKPWVFRQITCSCLTGYRRKNIEKKGSQMFIICLLR